MCFTCQAIASPSRSGSVAKIILFAFFAASVISFIYFFELVNAYLARRALDYLVGFNISPILWTKLPGSKSAGRVQSVALKIISEREHEVELFKPEEYWTIKCIFQNNKNEKINAKLNLLNNQKIEKFSFRNKNESDKAKSNLENLNFSIKSIESKPYKRNY